MIHGPYDNMDREILKALLFSRLNDLTCGIQFDKRAKTKGDLILRLVFMISQEFSWNLRGKRRWIILKPFQVVDI